MNKQLKAVLVVVGAIALSTIAINASDVLRGIDGSLSGLALEGVSGPCNSDAVFLQFGETTICMDTYEASPSDDCPINEPTNEIDTLQNIQTGSCNIDSKQDVLPWRFVSLTQAQQLCARAGKRLPSNEEWYKAVVGMGDINSCAIKTGKSVPDLTGSAACTTPAGVHDMIGNVWEWIEGEVQDGTFDNRQLPSTGYVSLVDSEGMVLETSDTPSPEYGDDYAWTSDSGIQGMLRGGFYNSDTDAGIFTINASVPLNFQTTGVGFRCVTDI